MKKIPVRQINTANQDFHSSSPFTIRRLEDIMSGADLYHDLHRHDYYFILFIRKGKGVHEIDFQRHEVQDRSVFFLRPGQVHRLELKAGTKGYLIEFKPEFYHPQGKESVLRFRKAGSKVECQPEPSRHERLGHILDILFEEKTRKEEGYLDAVRASLDLFIIEYIRQSPKPGILSDRTNPYQQEKLELFRDLVEKHARTHKQVSYYTRIMNLSAYQLNEITKGTVNKTASELISEYLVLEAKRYLLATSSQVKEVADQLGFEDTSYFIRYFKKQTGHTPELFRQKFR